MKQVLLLLCLSIGVTANAQLFTDSFTDANFTAGPAWTTVTAPAPFNIQGNAQAGPAVITSNTLHLVAPGGTGGVTHYLSTQNTVGWGTFQAWSFWIGRILNAPATLQDQTYVWLFANEANLSQPLSSTIDGYRVVFGDDTGNDEVWVERITNGVPSAPLVISSTAVVNGRSDYGFRVRVTRSSTDHWQIFTGVDLSTIVDGGGEAANANPYAVFNFGSTSNIEPGLPVPITGTGFFGLAARHGNTGPERNGAEWDQFNFQANGLLPVSFVSFNVIKDNNKARLNWQVADEKNVDGYEVERSANGVQFSRIGYVKAAGNSTYSFTDEKILNGVNFYRIKNVDMDGKFAYTHVVSINGKKGQFMTMFPIPARTDLYIQHHEAINGAQLRISTMEGRIVRVIKVPPNATQTILDLSTMQSGLYFVTYDAGDGNKFISKFIKQ